MITYSQILIRLAIILTVVCIMLYPFFHKGGKNNARIYK